MTNFCPVHNCELIYREGISKAKKSYKGWFCPEQGCKEVVWVNDKRLKVYSPKPTAPTQQDASVLNGLRELYLLQKATYLAIMSKQAVPPETAIKWLEENIIILRERK